MSNQPAPCGGRGAARAPSRATTCGPTQWAWKSTMVRSACARAGAVRAAAEIPRAEVCRKRRRLVIVMGGNVSNDGLLNCAVE